MTARRYAEYVGMGLLLLIAAIVVTGPSNILLLGWWLAILLPNWVW
jgi:hypothetical protein